MKAATAVITLPDINIERHKLFVIGTAPLLVHAFTEKARKQMLDKQMKTAKGGRAAREPYEEVEDAKYKLPDGRDGFPAVGFKKAAVTACTSVADITKVAARQAFRIAGLPMRADGVLDGAFMRTSLVPIISPPSIINEAPAGLAGRSYEMRYRPEYSPWGAELDVYINANVVSISQLGSIFQLAGMGVGIGDYRPEKDGDCGTFELVSESDFKAWRKENKI
jgi:hypothetical protein